MLWQQLVNPVRQTHTLLPIIADVCVTAIVSGTEPQTPVHPFPVKPVSIFKPVSDVQTVLTATIQRDIQPPVRLVSTVLFQTTHIQGAYALPKDIVGKQTILALQQMKEPVRQVLTGTVINAPLVRQEQYPLPVLWG